MGVPDECQPGTSHHCPCLCRPLGTAMAGDGELNRVIKDLQSKCASLSPASVSPAWHVSPWPSQVPPHTQPMGSGGCHCRGCTRAPRCQPCHCRLLWSPLPAPGDQQCLASTCALAPPAPPWQVPLSPAGRNPRGWELGGSREGGRDGTACPMPAQSCHPAETVAELNHSYREQNLPVTDGSRELHSLCAQLEFLLQVPCSSIPATPCLSFPWGPAQSRRDPMPAFSGGGMTPASIV